VMTTVLGAQKPCVAAPAAGQLPEDPGRAAAVAGGAVVQRSVALLAVHRSHLLVSSATRGHART
jgi:hypothetical protein